MTRFLKVLAITSMASVTLMQVPCTMREHGFSIFPSGLIPNPFTGLTGLLGF